MPRAKPCASSARKQLTLLLSFVRMQARKKEDQMSDDAKRLSEIRRQHKEDSEWWAGSTKARPYQWHFDRAWLLNEIERLRAEVAENDGVIAVWRRRCTEAEARVAELEAESGVSWSGFNLRGDAKSVSELRKLMDASDRLAQLEPYLTKQLADASQRVAELEDFIKVQTALRDALSRRTSRFEAQRDELRRALVDLLSSCRAIDAAHGRQVIDPHAEAHAEAVLAETAP